MVQKQRSAVLIARMGCSQGLQENLLRLDVALQCFQSLSSLREQVTPFGEISREQIFDGVGFEMVGVADHLVRKARFAQKHFAL